VSFDKPFNKLPFVSLNPRTSTPHTVDVNAGDIDTEGFNIYAWRNTNTNITVAWMAKGF
jgi:hypothetical protein